MAVKRIQYDSQSMHVDHPWNMDGHIPFLEKHFPFQFLVLVPLLRRILPRDIFLIFFAWKKKQLWGKFVADVEKMLQRSLSCRPAYRPNRGAKFYAYRVSAEEPGKPDIRASGHSIRSGDEALSKAIGEFLERFALNRANIGRRGIITMQRPRGIFSIDLRNFPLYLPWQKKETHRDLFTREDTDTVPLPWVRARSLISLRRTYVPAARVYWNMGHKNGEGIVNNGTTSGSGGGFTREQALLSATYELLERDSFMCHWLLKLTPRKVDPETIPLPELKALLISTKHAGMEVHYLDITTALGIPAIACILTRREKGSILRLGTGAASGTSPQRLFIDSLVEATSVANGLTRTRQGTVAEGSAVKPFRDRSINRGKRLSFWNEGVEEKKVSWFLTGKMGAYEAFAARYGVQEYTDKKAELKMLKRKFQTWVKEYGEGYHPYVHFPPHNKTISQLGFFAVSVVVPSLYPIYLEEHLATLDIASLRHWRETLSWLGEKDRALEVMNTMPHPFP